MLTANTSASHEVHASGDKPTSTLHQLNLQANAVRRASGRPITSRAEPLRLVRKLASQG